MHHVFQSVMFSNVAFAIVFLMFFCMLCLYFASYMLHVYITYYNIIMMYSTCKFIYLHWVLVNIPAPCSTWHVWMRLTMDCRSRHRSTNWVHLRDAKLIWCGPGVAGWTARILCNVGGHVFLWQFQILSKVCDSPQKFQGGLPSGNLAVCHGTELY